MPKLSRAERVMAIREGGWTDRMHTVLKHRPYRVDGHSWGVAVLAWTMFPAECNSSLLAACLLHDVPERWVGDSPHPAKYQLTEGTLADVLHHAEEAVVKTLELGVWLSDREQQILRFCDLLECLLWAKEEILLGNVHMRGTYVNCKRGLEKMPLWPEKEELVTEMLAVPGSEGTAWWKELMGVEDD